jgi:hypothetical protein
MKDHKDKLTEDQKKKLVEGAQFIQGGDDVDRLFDEIDATLAKPTDKDEKSHAE